MVSTSWLGLCSAIALQFSSGVLGQSNGPNDWKISASDANSGNPAAFALDSNTSTFWHSQYQPSVVGFPHSITLNMTTTTFVNSFVYLPRQDGDSNGNIGQHIISVSTDNVNWAKIAQGNYLDDSKSKKTEFPPVEAQYIRLTALSEAGNRGNWSAAASISVTTQPTFNRANPSSQGQWGLSINFPIVPVAIGLAPTTGKVVAWSAYSPSTFGGSNGFTQTSTWDPDTGSVTRKSVTNTKHDMFCPGINMDFNGRMIVTGGSDAARTSIYDPSSDSWISAPDMKVSRGYQSSTTLSDGRSFTIGGSWSGGRGGKNGEVYSPSTNAWSLLSGTPVAPMLTNDAAGVYRSDNHAWLFAWKNGAVFQAGPSKAMNWYGTSGSGNRTAAGTRASDVDSMCGTAVMYDAVAGKIVTMGGSTNYENVQAHANTHVVTIGNPGTSATTTAVASMSYSRAFANAVVLPDGKVLVNGGQSYPVPFSDNDAILTPELWDPATQTYTKMVANTVPRTYHSVSILLLDGTVFTGGGGLCGNCQTNHFDAQIFEPPYLFNSDGSRATRPTISTLSSTTVATGSSITVNTGGAVTSFSLVRYGTATHTVNTDQRRIPVTPTSTGTNAYRVTVPSDKGVALPGYWMLFAIDSNGVPSVGKTIKIT